MSTLRCPQCQLPATIEELDAGNCPACGVAMEKPKVAPPEFKPAPPTSSSGLWLSLMAVLLLATGAVGGFSLGMGAPGASNDDANSAEPLAQEKLVSALQRVSELESQTQTLRKEIASQKKPVADPMDKAELAAQAERLKELEALVESIGQERDTQKKNAAAATARADAATRDAEVARAELNKAPKAGVVPLNALTKKLQIDLKIQTQQLKDARLREQAALKTVEKVRQDGQRMMEQIRRW